MTDPGPVPERLHASLTYLGFDHGTRKIGIAVGQTLTCTAEDLDTVRIRGKTPDWERISRHVADWSPAALVVGLPLDSSGGETTMSRHARQFGQSLSDRYNLDVHWINEFLSSEAARQALSTRGKRNSPALKDQVAARLILETFLNEKYGGRKENG